MSPAGPQRYRLSLSARLLVVVVMAAGCAESADRGPATDGAMPTSRTAPEPVPQSSDATIRQGPMRIICYKDDVIVFEHGSIYRVFRPQGGAAGWSYETGDGLKFRGRIGENVNCVWQ